MVLLIGKNGCGSCDNAKSILKQRGIEYEYKELNSLPAVKRKEYMDKSRASNNLGLPLVFRDEDNIRLQELL